MRSTCARVAGAVDPAPGPGRTRTFLALTGPAQCEQTTTGSNTWPQSTCSSRTGRPRLPAMCASPHRMIANSTGCELLFTLFREPNMSDAQFASDAGFVQRDLNGLKRLLEK